MSASDYLRARALELRRMADDGANADRRDELLALALSCEKLANQMQGNGHAGPRDGPDATAR